MLQVKLVKSPIGNTARNRATVAALGLRKMHQTVYLPDNGSVRGMIHRVKHMLAVEVVDDASAPARVKSTPRRKRTTAPIAAEARVAKPATAKPKAEKPVEKVEAVVETAPQPEPKVEAKPKAEKPAEKKAAAPKTAAPKAAAPKAAASKDAAKGPKPKTAKPKES